LVEQLKERNNELQAVIAWLQERYNELQERNNELRLEISQLR